MNCSQNRVIFILYAAIAVGTAEDAHRAVLAGLQLLIGVCYLVRDAKNDT